MKKIVIVEDEKVIREELYALLGNAGYGPVAVTDFVHTVPEILNSGADLVLLDINIPKMNGEQVLREIRQKSEIPVIMVTSRTEELDEVLSMSYGADDYITKPYNQQSFCCGFRRFSNGQKIPGRICTIIGTLRSGRPRVS